MARTPTDAPDAVVVGAGPNGLVAAVTLARQGFRVQVIEAADEPGGGVRSFADPNVAGLVHDHCSAVYPLGVASPALRKLGLERYGLTWSFPDVELAHPLDDGTAVSLYRDLDRTVEELGVDGPWWERTIGRTAKDLDRVVHDLLSGPLLRFPRYPLTTARTGAMALLPATTFARGFPDERGRALFGGVAAHAITELSQPATTAIGLVLAAAGHAVGWPVATGGSSSIWKALVALLEDLGGEVVLGTQVTTFSDLPRGTRVALFDTTPTQLARIVGDHLPARERRRTERWLYGPAAYKLDLAIQGEVPWTAESARRAGTLHLGGTFDEIIEAESASVRGDLPERPFVLVSQPHVADPSREVDGITPLWTYAHVPHGCSDDVAPLIEAQLERFAPGVSERIVSRNITTPAEFEAWNPNLHGGDITAGAAVPSQLIARPRLALDPYRTAIPGLFLCSGATPPGPGVHGLSGANAAHSALKVLTA